MALCLKCGRSLVSSSIRVTKLHRLGIGIVLEEGDALLQLADLVFK